MNPSQGPGILVIGVGNAYRCDDAAGLLVARRVKERTLDSVAVLEHTGEGAALMESWKNAEAVVLIDAVSSGGAPGAVHRLDARSQPLPARMFRNSTHAFSVVEAVELGRALNRLPQQLIVYGIEGRDFEAGTTLSPEVEKAAQEVVERVAQEIQSMKNTARSKS